MFKNVIKGPRRSGKSTALMQLVVQAARSEEKKILVVMPTIDCIHYLMQVCADLLRDDISQYIHRPCARISLKNGSLIQFISAKANQYHGFTADMLAIDEHTHISDQAKMSFMPCVSCKPNAAIWMTECDDTIM